jgi:photosystem II stability/assembly factor-like uncharacterized protein
MKKSLIILGLVIGVTSSLLKAQTGWVAQTNYPVRDSFGKIQFVSSTEGWVSEAYGKLYHTTNAGTQWTIITPFPHDTVMSMSDPAISMWWVNQTHGWKINWYGTWDSAYGAVIYKTKDGGNTWDKKVLSTAIGDRGFQVQFIDTNNGWASIYNPSGTPMMRTLRSTDGGNTWDTIGTGGIFYFVDANNGWGAGGSKIYHTTNGGTNWSVQYTDPIAGGLTAIQFTDLSNGWVVGDSSSKILKTTDGGSTWTPITNAGLTSDSYCKCVFFIDANTGWIGANIPITTGITPQRAILHTTNGGTSWTGQYPDFLFDSTETHTEAVFSMFFTNSSTGWLTGDAGIIGHTTNGGSTGIAAEKNNIPTAFSLKQNYPNPFNPSTQISYQVPSNSSVSLRVFDLLGREVAALVNEVKPAGTYTATFHADNIPSGVYFYQLKVRQTDGGQAGTFWETRKMLLMK